MALLNVELISSVAFLTTIEADEPARSVAAAPPFANLLPPFDAWLCLEKTFDVFLPVLEDPPLTSFDVEQVVVAVSSLGLFSTGKSLASVPLAAAVAVGEPSSDGWPMEEQEEDEAAPPSAESGGDSVFLFLCVEEN